MNQKRVYIDSFPGMNNVQRQALVKMVHNMDTTVDGKLVKRDGYSLYLALPEAHSLISDGRNLFCLAKGTTSLESLYRIDNGAAVEVTPIIGKGFQLYYTLLPDRIYLSTQAWNGVYEYATGAVREWGKYYEDDPAMQDRIYTSEELITLNVIPAPHMENLCLAGGRIWGSKGRQVYYSDPPYAYEMYRPDTFLQFNDDVTLIAVTTSGMYFSTDNDIFFGQGHDPEAMAFSRVGDGALSGSLQYIPNFRGQISVPVWTSKQGLQVGISGAVLPLTREKLHFKAAGKVASMYRVKEDGAMQYLSSSVVPDSSFSDTVTCEVVRKGAL